jgi:hypothetical protein
VKENPLQKRQAQIGNAEEVLSEELGLIAAIRGKLFISPSNSRMVEKLTTTPLEMSFDMAKPISSGACNKIYKSTDGQFIFKPLPVLRGNGVSVVGCHCPLASATILAQNTEFTHEVADAVCNEFTDKRNPFVKPKFGYASDGTVGTAFPFVEGFRQFDAEPPPNLTKEQWQEAIVDLQKIGLVCAITGQNDINYKNIGFGADGKIYVVDYDLCMPGGTTEYICDNISRVLNLFVELGAPPSGAAEILKSGIDVARSKAAEIFSGDKRIAKNEVNWEIEETNILLSITEGYDAMEEVEESTHALKSKERDILSGLDMSAKEGVVGALERISPREPIKTLIGKINNDSSFSVKQEE